MMPKSVDGKGVSESIALIIDKIRYRKYAKQGFTIVISLNKANTVVNLTEGMIKDGLLKVGSEDTTKIVDKVYILPSKKIVTKLCFIKEDINTTIDILTTDVTKINDVIFKKFVNIRLLEDLQAFNIGQVMLGAAIGIVAGFILCMAFMAFYGAMI